MWTLSGFADEIDDDFEKQCAVLNQLGIANIELRSAWGVNVLDLDDEQLQQAKAILAHHEIAVSSIGSPIGKIRITDDFDRTWPSRHRVETGRDFLLRRTSDCSRSSSRTATTRTVTVTRSSSEWSALAARAEGHDVILLHENEKEIFGDIPRRCVDIVESVASPQLRLAWDAANFVQCGVRPFTEGYASIRPHLEYMQIKDAVLATGEVVPAGAGDGETLETIRALRSDGFDGYFSLEPHLATTNSLGGFSGEDLFTKAHTAFTGILRAEGIDYR